MASTGDDINYSGASNYSGATQGYYKQSDPGADDDSELNRQISRYNRLRTRIWRLCLVLTILSVVYLVLIASLFMNETPYGAFYSEAYRGCILEKKLSLAGKNLMLSYRNDSLHTRSILMGNDSTGTFEVLGELPCKDTLAALGASPDGNAIIVLERSGSLHLKAADAAKFVSVSNTVNSSLDYFTGLCFKPGTHLAYAYGGATILELDYVSGHVDAISSNGNQVLISLAFDPNGKAGALVSDKYKGITITLESDSVKELFKKFEPKRQNYIRQQEILNRNESIKQQQLQQQAQQKLQQQSIKEPPRPTKKH